MRFDLSRGFSRREEKGTQGTKENKKNRKHKRGNEMSGGKTNAPSRSSEGATDDTHPHTNTEREIPEGEGHVQYEINRADLVKE